MKNLLLSSVMLFAVSSSLAQLYVTNDGSSDTYVFVSDRVLYVEDDVNLTENPTSTRGAAIYLRNEAQLVQGAGTTANSGDGYISVIQDSNSDAYDYNFWSSPVGAATSTGNQNFGMTRVKDSTGLIDSDDSTLTNFLNGSGSGMGAADPLEISRRWLYRRNANTSWLAIHNANVVQPGYGFTMKGTNVTTGADGTTANVDANNQRYDFRGRPHNGDIDVVIDSARVTLAGNPYPSTLDLNLFYNDPDNTEIDEIRFWDEDRSINSHEFVQNKGGYGIWIPGTMPYVDGGDYVAPPFLNYNAAGNPSGGQTGTGLDVDRVYTPIGQGFNIYGFWDKDDMSLPANESDGIVTFRNSHRDYIKEGSSSMSNFRNNGGAQNSNTLGTSFTNPNGGGGSTTSNDPTPKVRIQTIFGESHYRELLLNFWPESTDYYDRGLDATHPMDAGRAEAYFRVIRPSTGDMTNTIIQTLPFESGKRIPLAFDLEQTFKFVVRADDIQNLQGVDFFVWDSEVDRYHEIGNGKDAVFHLSQGTYNDRFFLVFKDVGSSRGVEEETEEDDFALTHNMRFFQNNPIGQLEVANPEGHDIQTANIFDISGKLIAWKQEIGTQRSFSFPTGRLSDGVYIVKLMTTSNQVVTHKISVVNK